MNEMAWIKLSSGIFDDSKIRYIRMLPSGDSIVIVWLEMLCLAGKECPDGKLVMNETIPYTAEMMATFFAEPVNTVKLAIATFLRLGMIEVCDDIISIKKWESHQNVNGYIKRKKDIRENVKKYRERQKGNKQLATNSSENGTCNQNVITLEEEEEVEVEVEKTTTTTKPPSPSKRENRGGGLDPVIDFYEKNFQLRTPFTDELLLKLEDEYTAHWVVEAMKVAAKAGKRNVRYVEGILKRWKAEGFKAGKPGGNANALADVLSHVESVLPEMPGGDELGWLQEEGIGTYGSEQTSNRPAQGSVSEFPGRTDSSLRNHA